VSIVQVYEVTSLSFARPSRALTSNVCEAFGVNPEYGCGFEQGEKPPPSSWQLKEVTVGSLSEKAKFAPV
jgi:hypothetical protein